MRSRCDHIYAVDDICLAVALLVFLDMLDVILVIVNLVVVLPRCSDRLRPCEISIRRSLSAWTQMMIVLFYFAELKG